MSNSKIRVRHVGQGRAQMSTERTEEFAAYRHPVTFEAKHRLAAIGGIGFAPCVPGVDHSIDQIRDRAGETFTRCLSWLKVSGSPALSALLDDVIAISTARQGDHRQRVATAGRVGLRERQLVGGTVPLEVESSEP
jgi:hypothetical protein